MYWFNWCKISNIVFWGCLGCCWRFALCCWWRCRRLVRPSVLPTPTPDEPPAHFASHHTAVQHTTPDHTAVHTLTTLHCTLTLYIWPLTTLRHCTQCNTHNTVSSYHTAHLPHCTPLHTFSSPHWKSHTSYSNTEHFYHASHIFTPVYKLVWGPCEAPARPLWDPCEASLKFVRPVSKGATARPATHWEAGLTGRRSTF